MCFSSPDYPDIPPPPPPPPPPPAPTARSVRAPEGTNQARTALAARLGAQQLRIPLQNLNIPR